MKHPSRLNPTATSTGNNAIVKYTKLVRPRRRYQIGQRIAGFLTLLLMLGLLAVYALAQHTQPLPRRAGTVQVMAATHSDSNNLGVGTLRQGPTPTQSATAGTNLFAAPAATPDPLLDVRPVGGSIFSLPTATVPADPLRATPTGGGVVIDGADPLVAAAKAEPQLYSTFLSAQDALQQADPEQAVATLLTLAQNHPTYLTTQVTALLYTAYLAAGDQRMRAGERTAASDAYTSAQQLAVVDQSALTRRLESMARFLQTTNVAAAAPSVDLAAEEIAATELSAAAAAVTAVPTPTAAPTPTPATVGVAAVSAPRCDNPQVTITAPVANALLTGAVGFTGSAVQDNFWFYKLEWAQAGRETFAYFAGSRLPVSGGWLGTLDTTMLLNGDYVIRLTAVDLTGNYPSPCDLPVRIEN